MIIYGNCSVTANDTDVAVVARASPCSIRSGSLGDHSVTVRNDRNNMIVGTIKSNAQNHFLRIDGARSKYWQFRVKGSTAIKSGGISPDPTSVSRQEGIYTLVTYKEYVPLIDLASIPDEKLEMEYKITVLP